MSGVRIFTDGACSGHTNPVGGWCALVCLGSDEDLEEISPHIQTDGAIKQQRLAKTFERPDDGVTVTVAAIRMLSGHDPATTNNRMELTAAIQAVKALRPGTEATLYSDSEYVVNAINQNWLNNWKRYGWHNREGVETANRDLWEQLLAELPKRRVMFRLVEKGDGTIVDHMNVIADTIAKNCKVNTND